MAGLSVLKHMHDLSDEDLCARWIKNPYYQLFCGEEFFQHKLTFDLLVADALQRPADGRAAPGGADPGKPVGCDANRRSQARGFLQGHCRHHCAQPKAVAFPIDAKLMHRARERLVRLAKKTGVEPRQSYERVGKRALDRPSALCPRQTVQARQPGAESDATYRRPGHARHRAQRSRATPNWRASSPIRSCSAAGCASSTSIGADARLALGLRPEGHTRCMRPRSNASARARRIRPYEFRRQGVDRHHAASLGRRPVHRPRQGAAYGNPYDGHTLATVIPQIETQIGASLARIVADRGYRGHNAPPGHKFRVYISGQRRRVTETIKRELRRRSAVEPVIGHAKAEHRMGETTSPETTATPPTPSSPPPATTSAVCVEWLALLLSPILAALKIPPHSSRGRSNWPERSSRATEPRNSRNQGRRLGLYV